MTGLPVLENLTSPSSSYWRRNGAPRASDGMAVAFTTLVAVRKGSHTVSRSMDHTLRPVGLLGWGCNRAAMYPGVSMRFLLSDVFAWRPGQPRPGLVGQQGEGLCGAR